MKEPSAIDYLVGNCLVFWALSGSFLFFIGLGFATQDNGMFAVAASLLIPGCIVGPAAERIRRYNGWKREWDAMNGVPPRGAWIPKSVKIFAGVALLATLGLVGLSLINAPDTAVLAYLGGVLLALLVWVWSRLARRRSRQRAAEQPAVAQTLKQATHSPSAQSTVEQVPDYCREVLRQWEVKQ